MELFSTKDSIKKIIYSVDPYDAKMHDKLLYRIWFYGRDILPGHPNFEYLRGTKQLYLVKTFIRNTEFQEMVTSFPGFCDLYKEALSVAKAEEENRFLGH